jgi:hypothetical protein
MGTVETVEVVLFSILALLGVAGAVPHFLHWIRSKPYLKIVKASIDKQSAGDFRYLVHLEVENQRRWWRKNGDASNVLAEYYIIDKDALQTGYVSGQLVSPLLLSGTRATKDIESNHLLSTEGNPFLIVFRVSCNESVRAKKLVTYLATF